MAVNTVGPYVVQGMPGASDTYKVALMLSLAGVPWVLETQASQRALSEHTLHPRRLTGMTTLCCHGHQLCEAGAILDFLAEETRRFGPKSDDERRDILRWMLFEARYLGSPLAVLRPPTPGRNPSALLSDHLLHQIDGALALVDEHLTHHAFLLGRRLTIADIALGGEVFWALASGLKMAPLVHLENWLDQIRSQPGWKAPEEIWKH